MESLSKEDPQERYVSPKLIPSDGVHRLRYATLGQIFPDLVTGIRHYMAPNFYGYIADSIAETVCNKMGWFERFIGRSSFATNGGG
jgi:hypothetical protein